MLRYEDADEYQVLVRAHVPSMRRWCRPRGHLVPELADIPPPADRPITARPLQRSIIVCQRALNVLSFATAQRLEEHVNLSVEGIAQINLNA